MTGRVTSWHILIAFLASALIAFTVWSVTSHFERKFKSRVDADRARPTPECPQTDGLAA